jgi:hypothetical protein
LVSHDPPGSSQPADAEAHLSLGVFDICTFTELLSASGSVTLADGDFLVDRQLTSGALKTTINMVDFVSERSFRVTVDLTWAGTGIRDTFVESDIIRQAGTFANYRSIETHRDASPAGRISDGTTDFTPGWARTFGSLRNVISGGATTLVENPR